MRTRLLELRESEGGTVIRLRVKTHGGRDGVGGEHGGALKVSVSAAPEKGKANRAVLAVLAKELGIAAGKLRILSGETSQDKQVWAPMDSKEVRARLESLKK